LWGKKSIRTSIIEGKNGSARISPEASKPSQVDKWELKSARKNDFPSKI